MSGECGDGWACLHQCCVPTATAIELLADEIRGDCPAGYVRDDTRDDIVLCTRGADEMVRISDFWVDRYEGTIWSGADCTGTRFGEGTDDYPGTFPRNGNVTRADQRLFACSVRGVMPSVHVSWFRALQACGASGKHLVTNAEWQTAAAGTWDAGAVDGLGDTRCNTQATGPRATGGAGDTPGGSDSCISLWGMEDAIGNVFEWTADWVVSGALDPTLAVDGMQAWPWPAEYGSDSTTHVLGRAFVTGGWSDGVPSGLIRGGRWDEGNDAGLFAVSALGAPSAGLGDAGFRCARYR